MTAPVVDFKIHWLKMMSVPESRAAVGRHDAINRYTHLATGSICNGFGSNGRMEKEEQVIMEMVI